MSSLVTGMYFRVGRVTGVGSSGRFSSTTSGKENSSSTTGKSGCLYGSAAACAYLTVAGGEGMSGLTLGSVEDP